MTDQTAKSGLRANWIFTATAVLGLLGGLLVFAMGEGKDNGTRDNKISVNETTITDVVVKTNSLIKTVENHETRINNLEMRNEQHWEAVEAYLRKHP